MVPTLLKWSEFTPYILSYFFYHVPSISNSEMERIFGSNNSRIPEYIEFINGAKKSEGLVKVRVSTVNDLPYYKLVQEDQIFYNEE